MAIALIAWLIAAAPMACSSAVPRSRTTPASAPATAVGLDFAATFSTSAVVVDFTATLSPSMLRASSTESTDCGAMSRPAKPADSRPRFTIPPAREHAFALARSSGGAPSGLRAVHAPDRGGPPAPRIDFDQNRIQLHRPVGNFEARRQQRQKPLQHALAAHADHRVARPGHPLVADEGRPRGKDPLIRGLHLGMCAHDGRDAAIEVPGEG